MTRALLLILLSAPLVLITAAPLHAQESPRILGVTPAVRDSMLVCGLDTRGLPGRPSRETLASGLPSSLVLGFSLIDASGRHVGDSRAEIRIEPDLWEDVIFVRTPTSDSRVSSIADVEGLLSAMEAIPVFPLEKLSRDLSYRVRVRIAVHPLAPSAVRRSRDLLVEGRMTEPGRRETSVGLSSVLRFFLGKGDDEPWACDGESSPFTLRALPHLPVHPGGD